MKLELDAWRRLLNVYTKIQMDISKHVEKGWRFKKNRMKIIAQILKIYFEKKNGTYVQK